MTSAEEPRDSRRMTLSRPLMPLQNSTGGGTEEEGGGGALAVLLVFSFSPLIFMLCAAVTAATSLLSSQFLFCFLNFTATSPYYSLSRTLPNILSLSLSLSARNNCASNLLFSVFFYFTKYSTVHKHKCVREK